MKNVLLLSFSILIAIGVACQPVGPLTNDASLKPGDEIDGMILSTRASESLPLWIFCPSTLEKHGMSIDCQVPSVPRLAIGHTLGVTDPALQALDWSVLNWELSLDGQPIDLKAFGICEFVWPGLAASPSPIREIFRHTKAWDVVLINPTPGAHTLSGVAYDEAETYAWTVNFTVEASHTQ